MKLSPGARVLLDGLYETASSSLTCLDTGPVGREALRIVQEEPDAYDESLLREIAQHWLEVGAAKASEEWRLRCHSNRAVTCDDWQGNSIELKKDDTVGVSKRDEHGNRTGRPVRQLYWDLDLWQGVDDSIAKFVRQREALRVELAIYQQIARIREYYPHLKTVGELCDAIGIGRVKLDAAELKWIADRLGQAPPPSKSGTDDET